MQVQVPDFILPLVYVALLSLVIIKTKAFRLESLPRFFPVAAFSLKVLAGLSMYWLYTHYYTDRQSADIFRFYDDALMVFRVETISLRDILAIITGIGDDTPSIQAIYHDMNNWFPSSEQWMLGNSRFLIRFHIIAMLFSGGNYHVHWVLAAFIGFLGALLLWKAFHRMDPRHALPSFLVIFLIPSTLFWTSGALKESFLLLAIGLTVYGLVNVHFSPSKILRWVLLFLGLVLMSMLRPSIFFMSVVLIPCWYLSRNLSMAKGMLVYALAILVILIIDFTGILDLGSIIQSKQEQFAALGTDSILQLPDITDNPLSLILALPRSLFNAFLQPNLLNAETILEWLSAAEMIFIIGIILFLLIKFTKPEHSGLWLFLIAFSLIGMVLIGYTVPFAGAIVRYRSLFLPLLLLGLLHSSSFACPLMMKLNRRQSGTVK